MYLKFLLVLVAVFVDQTGCVHLRPHNAEGNYHNETLLKKKPSLSFKCDPPVIQTADKWIEFRACQAHQSALKILNDFLTKYKDTSILEETDSYKAYFGKSVPSIYVYKNFELAYRYLKDKGPDGSFRYELNLTCRNVTKAKAISKGGRNFYNLIKICQNSLADDNPLMGHGWATTIIHETMHIIAHWVSTMDGEENYNRPDAKNRARDNKYNLYRYPLSHQFFLEELPVEIRLYSPAMNPCGAHENIFITYMYCDGRELGSTFECSNMIEGCELKLKNSEYYLSGWDYAYLSSYNRQTWRFRYEGNGAYTVENTRGSKLGLSTIDNSMTLTKLSYLSSQQTFYWQVWINGIPPLSRLLHIYPQDNSDKFIQPHTVAVAEGSSLYLMQGLYWSPIILLGPYNNSLLLYERNAKAYYLTYNWLTGAVYVSQSQFTDPLYFSLTPAYPKLVEEKSWFIKPRTSNSQLTGSMDEQVYFSFLSSTYTKWSFTVDNY